MLNNVDNVLDSAFCKTESHDGQLHRWKSWEANTPFAPTFDVPIWLDNISDEIIEGLVYAMEENDIGMYRQLWEDYNIFKWEYEAVAELKKEISNIYSSYMDALGLPTEEVFIRGWAVVLQPGEAVKQHCHAYHENTYLSANLALCNDTVTEYIIPHLSSYYGTWKAENVPGRVAMFPSWVEHYVEPVEKLRYSMGFDIFDANTMNYVSDNKIPGDKAQETILHSIPLA